MLSGILFFFFGNHICSHFLKVYKRTLREGLHETLKEWPYPWTFLLSKMANSKSVSPRSRMLTRSIAIKSLYRSSLISMSVPSFLRVYKRTLREGPREGLREAPQTPWRATKEKLKKFQFMTLSPINTCRLSFWAWIFSRGESKNDQRFENENEINFEGKWIFEAFLPHPLSQEKVWLNSTRQYIYVNKEKRKA